MEEKYIFGHKNPDTDTIISAIILEKIEKAKGEKAKAFRLGNINKETKYILNYFKETAPELLEKVEEGQEVELVDHNEFKQSVQGIENAKIKKVIDHHRISNFETSEPLEYIAKPVGSTATILAEICNIENIKIDKQMAGLILSAIISDTLLLKSPTCTNQDKETAEKLAKISGIDINTYGLEMLKAGTDLSDFTPQELINIDSKPFETKGLKYQVAQVNTASIEDVLKDKANIENAMQNFMQEKGIELFVLMITDIIENNSQFIVLGKEGIVEKAFNVKVENNTTYLPGVVSRKKQVVPNIDKAI